MAISLPWKVAGLTAHLEPVRLSWFRDYGAYCGVTASGKSLYAGECQVLAASSALA